MTDILYTIGAETKGVDQADSSLNKLEKTVLDNVRAVERFERDHKKLDRAFNQGRINAQQYALGHQQLTQQFNQTTSASDRQVQALERNISTMQRGQRVTLQTGSAQQAIRQRFLETANSVAVLDGPLGGIASRFSAFGVLVGRTGVALAALAVSFTSLTVIISRGVRAFAEFEVQMATIENRLNSVGSSVALSSAEIDGMARSIAASTLASERDLRSAAAQMLTFGNVSTEVFEQVLRSAQDMAASGFGTTESAALALSKAIEDPRQSLTSLSRAGITFTRQQRAMIISLIESGRQLEAYEILLGQVDRRIGGAAEAQARDTLAGSFDTIGQALSRLTRDIGQFVADRGVRQLFGFIAGSLEGYAAGPLTPSQRLELVNKEINDIVNLMSQPGVRETIERIQQLESGDTDARGRAELSQLRDILSQITEGQITGSQTVNNLLREQADLERERDALNVRAARSVITQREESIANLGAEIDAMRDLLFLTEEEKRLNQALAAQRLANADIAADIRAYGDELLAAGVSQEFVNQITSRLANELLPDAEQAARDFVDTLTDQELSRQFNSINESLTQQNETQRIINEALAQGATQAEARLAAEDEMQNNLIRQLTERLGAESAVVQEIIKQVEEFRKLRDQNEALTEERRKLEQATGFLENLEEENRILELQLGLMEDGVDEADARRKAEELIRREMIEQEILFLTLTDLADGLNDQEVERLNTLRQITAEMDKQAGLETAVREKTERRRSARGSRGGAGASGPSPAERVEELFASMEREFEMRQKLIGATEEQAFKIEREFRLKEQINGIEEGLAEQYEERIKRMVEEEAALRKLEEAERSRQQQMQRFQSIMENAFMSLIDGSQSVEDAFKGMIRAILLEIVQQQVVKPMVGNILSLLPFAKGGVVQPFAKGGVVDGPTLFPMSGRKTGLMGEAGPEAIMPLKRTRDGSLGVVAEGAGTEITNVNVSFNFAANGDESVKRIIRGEMPKMTESVKAAVADGKRRGGSYGRAFS